MADSRPDLLLFYATARLAGLAEACERYFDAARAAGLPTVTGCEVPASAGTENLDPDELLERIRNRQLTLQAPVIDLHLRGGSLARLFERKGVPGSWRIRIQIRRDDQDGWLAAAVESLAVFCRHLLERAGLDDASVTWVGGGAQCLPRVPLASDRSHLVVTSAAEIARNYEDTEAFLAAGWSHREEHGDSILLLRATDVKSGREYLERALEGQWQMARAALAGKTVYYAPRPLADEDELFRAGEKTLEPVGYLRDERLVEFSCIVDESRHVNGWEVYTVKQLVDSGRLPSGDPVENVRVVFYTEAMARREKRPLLDAGARVFFMSETDDDVEIVD